MEYLHLCQVLHFFNYIYKHQGNQITLFTVFGTPVLLWITSARRMSPPRGVSAGENQGILRFSEARLIAPGVTPK